MLQATIYSASAKRGGVRLISTVMGTNSMKSRENQTLAGLSYSFRTHEMKDIIKAGDVIEASAKVLLGESKYIALATKDALKMYLPKRGNKFTTEAVFSSPLPAPIKKGEKVGVVRVTFENGVIKERDLIATTDVAALTGAAKVWQQLKN